MKPIKRDSPLPYELDSYEWFSCKDYESNRSEKCKHLYAVKYAIKLGIFKDKKTSKPIIEQNNYIQDLRKK